MDARHVDALPTRLPEHLSVPIRLVRPRPGRRTRDTTACVAHPSAHDAIADHPDTREARVSASAEPSLPKARAPNTDQPAFLVFDTNNRIVRVRRDQEMFVFRSRSVTTPPPFSNTIRYCVHARDGFAAPCLRALPP